MIVHSRFIENKKTFWRDKCTNFFVCRMSDMFVFLSSPFCTVFALRVVPPSNSAPGVVLIFFTFIWGLFIQIDLLSWSKCLHISPVHVIILLVSWVDILIWGTLEETFSKLAVFGSMVSLLSESGSVIREITWGKVSYTFKTTIRLVLSYICQAAIQSIFLSIATIVHVPIVMIITLFPIATHAVTTTAPMTQWKRKI